MVLGDGFYGVFYILRMLFCVCAEKLSRVSGPAVLLEVLSMMIFLG